MIPEKIMETLSDEWVVNKNEPDTISNGPRILRIFQNRVTPEIFKGDEEPDEGFYDDDHEKSFTVCINVLEELYSSEDAPIIIPEILTPDCFVDHPGPAAVLCAAGEIDPKYIERKPGAGKNKYAYVKGHRINTMVNFAFEYRAGFKVDNLFRDGDVVLCLGHIILPFDNCISEESHCGFSNITYLKDDDGNGGKKFRLDDSGNKIPTSIGVVYQAAITNCKKKCWSTKNIADQIYSGRFS